MERGALEVGACELLPDSSKLDRLIGIVVDAGADRHERPGGRGTASLDEVAVSKIEAILDEGEIFRRDRRARLRQTDGKTAIVKPQIRNKLQVRTWKRAIQEYNLTVRMHARIHVVQLTDHIRCVAANLRHRRQDVSHLAGAVRGCPIAHTDREDHRFESRNPHAQKAPLTSHEDGR